MGRTQVQLYGIEPGARTKWIVVKQLDGQKTTLKVFLRQNEKFMQHGIDELPRATRRQILQRFPNLAADEKRSLPGKPFGKGTSLRATSSHSVKEFRSPLPQHSSQSRGGPTATGLVVVD